MKRGAGLDDFKHVELPALGKKVLRLGVASNYGLQTDDVRHAADRGVNFWLWTPRFKTATPALAEIIPKNRDDHVVAVLASVAYTAGMVRRTAEKSLKLLGVDQLDLLLLPWLGKASFFTKAIQAEMLKLKDEGKVKLLGTSIHDRVRAGKLARESIFDAFMIRYNAKHPGAEQDVFPHLFVREPILWTYTATSWRQLIRPIKGLEMPEWPGDDPGVPVPPMTAAMCYRFALSNPHVKLTLTGPGSREQLDENLKALDQGPLSEEEEAWIRDYGRKVRARKKLDYV